jgi:hypothetical protein
MNIQYEVSGMNMNKLLVFIIVTILDDVPCLADDLIR